MINLGKGWKTLTGAIGWGMVHVGIVTAVVELVAPGHGAQVATVVGNVSAALAAIGLADKANKAPALNPAG